MANASGFHCDKCPLPTLCEALPIPLDFIYFLLSCDKKALQLGLKMLNGEVIMINCQKKKGVVWGEV